MSTERIGLMDNTRDIVTKLAEGNPGATRVCCELLTFGGEIDPDSALGGLGALLELDSQGIYGPRIWMLYKDVCGESLLQTVAALRAAQLGLLPDTELSHAIDHYGSGVDPAKVLDLVRTRLPRFAAENPAA